MRKIPLIDPKFIQCVELQDDRHDKNFCLTYEDVVWKINTFIGDIDQDDDIKMDDTSIIGSTDEILKENTFIYEVTVTFNQSTQSQLKVAQASALLPQYLLTYTQVYMPEFLLICKEYTKKGAPHYHCFLKLKTEMDIGKDNEIQYAFKRFWGHTTVTRVLEPKKYFQYVIGDVDQKKSSDGRILTYVNSIEKGFSHLNLFYIDEY